MSYSGIKIANTGNFLKIESGSPQQIRILSPEPKVKTVHFADNKSIDCQGEMCPLCAEGNEARQRFAAKVYDHTVGRTMIWEFGPSIAKQLRDIDANLEPEKMSILDIDLKISASGSGKQKKYLVMPWTPAKPLPAGVKETEIPF